MVVYAIENVSFLVPIALSTRIIDRIFDGTVIRGWDVASPVKFTPGKMTYSDFVWFLLSEEDKKTPTSIGKDSFYDSLS